MVAGAEFPACDLAAVREQYLRVVIQAWGAASTFDLFQFTDRCPNPLALRRQSLRISLRIHHHGTTRVVQQIFLCQGNSLPPLA